MLNTSYNFLAIRIKRHPGSYFPLQVEEWEEFWTRFQLWSMGKYKKYIRDHV